MNDFKFPEGEEGKFYALITSLALVLQRMGAQDATSIAALAALISGALQDLGEQGVDREALREIVFPVLHHIARGARLEVAIDEILPSEAPQ